VELKQARSDLLSPVRGAIRRGGSADGLMSPLAGHKEIPPVPFPHGWGRGPQDDARQPTALGQPSELKSTPTGPLLRHPESGGLQPFPPATAAVQRIQKAKKMDSKKRANTKKSQKVLTGIGIVLALAHGGCSSGGSAGSTSGSSSSSNPTPTLSSIAVTPANPSIAVGAIVRLTATGTYSDQSTQDVTASATWTSSAVAVATVGSGTTGTPGVATGVSIGTATITAAAGSVSNSVKLAVVGSPVVTSIAITPASPSLSAGSTTQLTATATYSDGTSGDISHAATWASSNTGTAVVETHGQSSPGLVTALASGSTTITATYTGITGTDAVTVTGTAAALKSIAITPSTATAAVGGTVQYIATGTYSDNTTQNISASVSWTSGDPAEATIESQAATMSGLATGVAAGSLTITATLNGISGLATLIVTNSNALFDAPPIMDAPQKDGSCLAYKSFQGGLYENCSDAVPPDHDSDGKTIVPQVQPLDADGNPSAHGKIVLASIGMSAAFDEFAGFVLAAQASSAVSNTSLIMVNGAESNQDACFWFPAFGPPTCYPTNPNNYDRVDGILAKYNLTPLQVQAVWLKNANGRIDPGAAGCSVGPCVPLCDETLAGCTNSPETTDALNYEQELGNIIRAAKTRWPNLKFIFITSRLYGGYAPAGAGSPEPFAYESGYAVKWVIQAQIDQMAGKGVDPIAGDLSYNVDAMNTSVAPWIGWGPYFWAAGPIPRSDGLVWCDGSLSPGPPCNGEVDFEPDGEHPSSVTKQVKMLMSFFLNSPYTLPWFAVQPAGGAASPAAEERHARLP